MALKFTTSREAAQVHGVKALVYSKAGAGKTMLTATAPKPLVISAESGLLSLRPENIARIFGADMPGITYDLPVIEVHTIDDLMDAFTFAASADEAKGFETICLDSITEIAEVVLTNAKRQVKDPRQAYGELIEKMLDTIKKFRDLPNKHVYMAAKQEPFKDETSGVTLYGPAMPGSKLGQQIPYLFDEVFHLGIGKDKDGNEFRYLRTRADLQYDAKDRSGALDQIEYPNLTGLFNKIIGVNNNG